MDYRNERDALRGRVESLEQALEDAQRELAEARRCAGDAEAEGSRADVARVERMGAALSEAEALVQRLRRELTAVKEMHAPDRVAVEHATRLPAGVTQGAPANPRDRLVAPSAVLALAAIAILAIALGYRAHRETCEEAAACCRNRGGDTRKCAALSGSTCGWYLRQYTCEPIATRAATVIGVIDYFENATAVPGMFQAKMGGPVLMLSLSISHDTVVAEIQDPRRSGIFDRYVLYKGKIGDGDPVDVTHKSYQPGHLVDIRSLDFAAVPKMARDAVAQLEIEDARVSSMIVTGGSPFEPAVSWQVYVQGPRGRGWVEYDQTGHRRAVHK